MISMRVNPFKPHRSHSTGGESSEDSKEESMSLQDAAKLSLILTAAQIFIGFLTIWSWSQICQDPPNFLWELLRFSGATFFGFFLVISGIARTHGKPQE